MRTLLLALLLLAACSGDDDGIGPFPDGGDPFLGEYSATWTPDAPWPTVTITACDSGCDYLVNLWEAAPRGECDLTDCWVEAADIEGACIVNSDSTDGILCPSDGALSGTIDAMTVEYQVILTRR
jgi:hypothetical protein